MTEEEEEDVETAEEMERLGLGGEWEEVEVVVRRVRREAKVRKEMKAMSQTRWWEGRERVVQIGSCLLFGEGWRRMSLALLMLFIVEGLEKEKGNGV